MNYDLCLELANNLEGIKKYKLRGSPIVIKIGKLMYDYQITDVFLLNEIVESLRATALIKSEDGDTIDLTPQALLNAEIVARDIYLLVEHIRMKIFGKSEIPFSNIDDAIKWLKKQGKELEGELPYYTDEIGGYTVKTLPGGRIYHKYDNHWFEFSSDSPYIILDYEVKEIAHITAATSGSVMMHILADTKLALQKYIWSAETRIIPSYYEPTKPTWMVTIRSPLSFNEMRSLHRSLRRMFGSTRKKEINVKDLEIYRLVNVKGGIPNKKIVAFWKDVMHEWNERHPEDNYTTWKGVKRRYDLLMTRLESRKMSISGETRPKLHHEKKTKRRKENETEIA